jgi:LuxR family transcriptional regulator, maltose regulon positive regulatory protein
MAEPATTAPSTVAELDRAALLATKLHVPRPRAGLVPRPRLLERLAEGMGRDVILVCTPAGFGKTTLLAEWARTGHRPVAWLSLDPGDNDPARFWRHAAAALDTVQPGLAERVAGLLGGLPASFEAVVATLVDELAADEVVLVLDDYHLVQAPAVHASLEFLLEHPPPQLRLVLASRADPPLPLARLRAGRQLLELREADLRFTSAEAAELLRAAVEVELPEAAVAALEERRGGSAGNDRTAQRAGTGGAWATGRGPVQQGDRRGAGDQPGHSQAPRQPHPGQAGRGQPHPGRCPGPGPGTAAVAGGPEECTPRPTFGRCPAQHALRSVAGVNHADPAKGDVT